MKTKRQSGLTLLEVILALAILGLSLAAVGQAVRLGGINALAARDLTTAQILCDSKMSEVVSGAVLPETLAAAPSEFDPEWLVSVVVEPVDDSGLLLVEVTVEQDPQFTSRPASFTLKRWMMDPAVLEAMQPTEEDALAEDLLLQGTM